MTVPCRPLHEDAEIKRRVQEEEEAVPQADAAVHRGEVDAKVLADTVDYCNGKMVRQIQ